MSSEQTTQPQTFDRDGWIRKRRKVMYSIYGDAEGPWYFGETDETIESDGMKVNLTLKGDPYCTYAKLVVPFENFNPYELEQNLKFNLCKRVSPQTEKNDSIQ